MILEPASPYQRAYLCTCCSILLALPFHVTVTYCCIGAAAFVWLVGIRQHVQSFPRALTQPLLVFTSLFVIQIVGLIHTDNMISGINKIEGKLGMLVLPLLVFVSTLTRRDIRLLKWSFVLSTITACLCCFASMLIKAIANGHGIAEILTLAEYKYTAFTDVINIHPTYLTLFTAFSFFLLTSLVKGTPLRIRYSILGVSFLYVCLVSFQAVSRAGVIAFILALFITGFAEILYSKKYRLLLVLMLVLILFITSIVMSEFWRRKFIEDFRNISGSSLAANDSSIGQHVKSWKCAVELILTDHFIFGYGTGDEKDVLATCYEAYQWRMMTVQKNDAHNEYLSSGIRHGIIGIALLLFCFGFGLRYAWQTRDWIYLAFLVMFVIVCLSESSLKARTSLVYFCMLNAILYKDRYLQESQK
ncbi:MAG TPA: O-antigen ligase family protein [Ohtaekwangia sp.]